MAFDLQLSDVKASSIRNIAGVCVDSPEFVQTLNEITRKIMRRGGFWGTEVLLKLCLQGCRVVWPRMVGTVLGLRFCRSGAATLYNNHWSIWGYRGCSWWNGGWRGGDVVVRDDGTRPCYNEITGNTGQFVTARIVHIADVGKKIRIFGTQFGNQPIEEKDSTGAWVPGLTLTLTQAGVTTSMLITKITSVTKELTEGRVFLYQQDPSTSALYDLAVYEYNETNPAYRCSVIQNFGATQYFTDSNGIRKRSVEALVKLEFVPVRTDDDFVLIDNIEALKYAFQSFRLSEAGDDAGAEIKFALAIKEMNMSIRDREPSLETVVRVNSISSNYPIVNPC